MTQRVASSLSPCTERGPPPECWGHATPLSVTPGSPASPQLGSAWAVGWGVGQGVGQDMGWVRVGYQTLRW